MIFLYLWQAQEDRALFWEVLESRVNETEETKVSDIELLRNTSLDDCRSET